MVMEVVGATIKDIEEEYRLQIPPLKEELPALTNWLSKIPSMVTISKRDRAQADKRVVFLTEEIKKLEKAKKERLLALHETNSLVAPTLEDLNRLLKTDFNELLNRYGPFSIKQASSNEPKKIAYWCYRCELWIIGTLHLRPWGTGIFSPHEHYFCLICGTRVGGVRHTHSRMMGRQHRP